MCAPAFRMLPVVPPVCESSFCIDGKCSSDRLDDMAPCSSNFDCISATCARKSIIDDQTICCPQGFSPFETAVAWSVQPAFVCSKQEVGVACNLDSLCETGSCINNACAAERLGDGEVCGANAQCKSHICAYRSPIEEKLVCCVRGAPAIQTTVQFSSGKWNVCGLLELQDPCTSNSMCKSGLCIEGVCADSLLVDGSPCQLASHCLSNVCASNTTTRDNLVCCRSGATNVSTAVSWSSDEASVCTKLQPGDTCNFDNMCETGLCIEHMCSNTQLQDNDICAQSAHCKSRTCAYESPDSPVLRCCSQGAGDVLAATSFSDESVSVCLRLELGMACNYDSMCETGICVGGICSARRRETGSQCASDDDCLSLVCAAPNNTTRPTVCCQRGSSPTIQTVSWDSTQQPVCAFLAPVGVLAVSEQCSNATECQSGACVRGACVESRLADTSLCEFQDDCLNGACAAGESASGALKSCCVNGTQFVESVSWTSRSVAICGGLSDGQQCHSNRVCESGICIGNQCSPQRRQDLSLCDNHSDCMSGACAREESLESALLRCCREGSIFVENVAWSTSTSYAICGNLPAGARCDSGRLCDSAICIDGHCADNRLEDLAVCSVHSDCRSGRCAREESLSTARTVCCKGGSVYLEEVAWSQRYDYYVCGKLPMDSKCDSGRVCENGICIDGSCVNERRTDWEACSLHTDCSSGQCAREESLSSALFRCCRDGIYFIENVAWSTSAYRICGMLEDRALCDSGRVCESGTCIGNKCVSVRKADLESCVSHNDCLSGRCGLIESLSNAPKVCCANGVGWLEPVSWSSENQDVCGQLPSGAQCETNRVCESFNCIGSKCSWQRLGEKDNCEVNDDCQHGVCARDEDLSIADRMCCSGGSAFLETVEWSSNSQSICGNLETGVRCSSSRVCSSGSCIDAECV